MLRRSMTLLASATLALCASAALAQQPQPQDQGPVAEQKRKIRTIVVYGDDPCPAESATSDEIVVCARQPERERYRLPEPARKTDAPPEQSWAGRVRAMDETGKSGIGSCSPVGPGGATGCTVEQLRKAQAEKQQTEGEASTVP